MTICLDNGEILFPRYPNHNQEILLSNLYFWLIIANFILRFIYTFIVFCLILVYCLLSVTLVPIIVLYNSANWLEEF